MRRLKVTINSRVKSAAAARQVVPHDGAATLLHDLARETVGQNYTSFTFRSPKHSEKAMRACEVRLILGQTYCYFTIGVNLLIPFWGMGEPTDSGYSGSSVEVEQGSIWWWWKATMIEGGRVWGKTPSADPLPWGDGPLGLVWKLLCSKLSKE